MYTVRYYEGKYRDRQNQANEDKCIAYIEHHLNSCDDQSAGYACVVVGKNASDKSKEWGKWYAQAVADEFSIKCGGTGGILVGGYEGRGNNNIYFTKMPAILVEPLFVSNPAHVEWIKSEDGQSRLANVLFKSIKHFFPDGGLVGFSIGHKGNKPGDRGAKVYGDNTMCEADYAELVLQRAESLLISDSMVA